MKSFTATAAPGLAPGDSGRRGVSLAARITLLLMLVMAVTAAGLAWFGQQIVLDRFAATELELVVQNRNILDQAIRAKLATLEASVTDWAQWDDLYDFVQGRNPEFRTTELGNVVLDRLKLDMLLLIDPAGHLQYGDVRPDESTGAAPHPGAVTGIASLISGAAAPDGVSRSRGPSVLPKPGSTQTITGVINTSLGPMTVALRRISRTDGSGENAGTLVMGNYLHAEKLFTALSVLPSTVIVHGTRREESTDGMQVLARDLGRTEGGSRLVTRQDDMSDFRLFRDLAGNPVFMLETRMPRSIVATGRDTARMLLLTLLVAVVVMILMLVALIRGIVSDPLGRLTSHLLSLRESAEPRPTPGHERSDEIGMLARRFEELQSARREDQGRLEKLAAAVKHAGDAIAILDADGRISYVNPQYERQTGFSLADVLGKTPSSGKNSDATYDELWATVRAGLSWSGMLQSTGRSGTIRYEEVTVAPITDGTEQHAAGYIAVMRDITARRETEAKVRNLSAVVENTGQSIVLLDVTGRIQYVNPAYERNRGVRSADVLGKAPGEAIKGLDDQQLYASLWHAVAGGGTWTGRISTELPDGRVLTEDAVVSPVAADGVTTSSYAIVLHDVTERIRLEGQLAQAQRLEAVGQLAAGVAHEINTPTQYVGGNIRFLQDAFTTVTVLLGEITRLVRGARDGSVRVTELARVLSAADSDYLQAEVPVAIRQSLEGVERVGEIVKSMRELTHPARDLIPTNLNAVVESAVRVAGSEWHGIAGVSTRLDPALPPVPCLAGSINQVIVNMLVNAAHAIELSSARRGGQPGLIVVATRVVGGAAEIRITDNGAGMSKEVRARIFDPFFTTKEVGQGTGQGLAIAHSVVKRHQGSITVDSEPGRGTCFTILLPLAQGTAKAAAGDAAA